jgi:hypothetical protein
MDKRKELDQILLEIYEDLTRNHWLAKEKLNKYNQNCPQISRFLLFEEKLATERRLIEEISLPCRLILEHLTTFEGNLEQTIGYKIGNYQAGRALLNSFQIKEWGNIVLNLGHVQLTWRDEEYKYLFYPDKVVLRAFDINKPEIHLNFSFYFKYSHVLEKFQDVKEHPQVEYWHEDLNL